MNITVCVKQVPAAHEMSIDEKTHTLNRENVQQIINPSDENALETALMINDEVSSQINVLSMGNLSAQSVLKDALQRGAYSAYLINDKAFAGSDTYSTAVVLSSAIKKIGECDLVVCGSRTVDGETGQVGPELAVLLDMPCITNVISIDSVNEKSIVCKRQIDLGTETLKAALPVLITVGEGINKLRLPSIMSMREGNKKNIVILDNNELNIDENMTGLKGSPTKVTGVFIPRTSGRNGTVRDISDEAVAELLHNIEKLRGAQNEA